MSKPYSILRENMKPAARKKAAKKIKNAMKSKVLTYRYICDNYRYGLRDNIL